MGNQNYEKNFELGLDFLFPSEGGYSNHKNDKGGATNMGVTQATYNYYLKKHNLPTKDVKGITKGEAKQIYYDEYWKTSGADKIENPKLAIAVFDTAVLHGPGQAKNFYTKSGGNLDEFLRIRKESYNRIVTKDPSQKVFLKGWNNRVGNLKKYTDGISSTSTSNENKDTTTLYGRIEYNESPTGFEAKVNDNPVGKIFTAEEIGAMPPAEFKRNEMAIDEQLKGIGVPREHEAKQAVSSGGMIWVEGYKRDDSTEVKGYYRSK